MWSLIDSEGISYQIVIDLFDGVETDLEEKVKINSKKELLVYSYRVAGTVGLMMSKILKVKNKEALKGAIDLGIAMQLTNIARDVCEDRDRNRQYIKPGFSAIKETINKTNLSDWKVGTKVNLERCTKMNGRLDGHIVQGHVDTTGTCLNIEDENGSWKYTFKYNSKDVTVEKGSITINGISLTVLDSKENSFSVCIIPYTYENTNIHEIKAGDLVNLEFDIIGKYIAKLIDKRNN